MNRDLPSIVFYHKSCNDGFAAATTFNAMLNKNNTSYIPVQYGEVNTTDDLKKLVTDMSLSNVYIVDFSFPTPVMQYIRDNAASMTWLDHHKTAFEMGWPVEAPVQGSIILAEPNFYMCLDNNRSGALIAWHFLHGLTSQVPDLIRFVDDYDRWVFQYEATRAYIRGLRSKPMTFEVWGGILRDSDSTSELTQTGAILLAEHNNDVEAAAKNARPVALVGYQGLAVNSIPKLTSDTGHVLAHRCGTFGMIYHITEMGKAKCSLRSVKDFDVSIIAKHFGGGGHKNAAGFECSAWELLNLLGVAA